MQRHLEVRKHSGYKNYYKEWGQNRALLESISSHYLSIYGPTALCWTFAASQPLNVYTVACPTKKQYKAESK